MAQLYRYICSMHIAQPSGLCLKGLQDQCRNLQKPVRILGNGWLNQVGWCHIHNTLFIYIYIYIRVMIFTDIHCIYIGGAMAIPIKPIA